MNKTWLKAAGIRAIKTIAQTAIATIGTSALISEVDWLSVISASVVAGILSLLTSVVGLPEVEEEFVVDEVEEKEE
jgi:ABC-type lipoprotein release transport system permease subunit